MPREALFQFPQANIVDYGPNKYLKTKKKIGIGNKILPPSDPKPQNFVVVSSTLISHNFIPNIFHIEETCFNQ